MPSGDDKRKRAPKRSAGKPAREQGAGPKRAASDGMDELHAREATLRGVLNATQESIVLFSADGILRMANEIALTRLGMPAEAAIGRHVTDLIPPDLAKARMTHLNDVVRTGNPVEFEDTREGILFRHTVSPVFDSRGNVTDVAIYSRDITRQRENEERLSYLASFPQLNPNPVLEMDLAGSVTFANPAAYQMLARLSLDSREAKAFAPADMDSILAAWDRKSPLTVAREVRIADRVFSTSTYLDPGLNVARIYSFDSTERKQVEEALRRSEAKYRLLFENMGEGFALYELLYDGSGAPVDWRVLEVNDAYVVHTGVSRDRIVGRRMSEIFPAAIPEYLPRFAAVVATQKPVKFDTYAKLTQRHHHVVCFPAGPHRFANTVTDITGRKLAEEALRKSEEQYRRIVETANEGIWVVDADRNTTYVNDKMAAMLRCDVQDMIGRSGLEFLDREGRALSDANIAKRREGVSASYELKMIRRDAAPIWALVNATPLFDRAGTFAGTLSMLTDITERKLAEERLREREQKYRTLIDRMIDGFALHEIVLDASGLPRDYRFLEVNRAFERLTGLRSADIVGKCVTEVLPGVRESEFDWIGAYGKVALTGEELRTEQYAEELKKWYAITAYSPEKGFFATIFEDITARKKAEDAVMLHGKQLAERNEELARFNRVAVDRELRMIELKKEINAACTEAGRPRRYPLAFENGPET